MLIREEGDRDGGNCGRDTFGEAIPAPMSDEGEGFGMGQHGHLIDPLKCMNILVIMYDIRTITLIMGIFNYEFNFREF